MSQKFDNIFVVCEAQFHCLEGHEGDKSHSTKMPSLPDTLQVLH